MQLTMFSDTWRQARPAYLTFNYLQQRDDENQLKKSTTSNLFTLNLDAPQASTDPDIAETAGETFARLLNVLVTWVRSRDWTLIIIPISSLHLFVTSTLGFFFFFIKFRNKVS